MPWPRQQLPVGWHKEIFWCMRRTKDFVFFLEKIWKCWVFLKGNLKIWVFSERIWKLRVFIEEKLGFSVKKNRLFWDFYWRICLPWRKIKQSLWTTGCCQQLITYSILPMKAPRQRNLKISKWVGGGEHDPPSLHLVPPLVHGLIFVDSWDELY